MKETSLKRNALLNIIYSTVNILFPIVTFPYVARILELNDIGRVSFFSTIATYGAMFASMGISVYGIRSVASCKNDKSSLNKCASELLFINLVATLMLICLILATSVYVERLSGDRFLLYLCCVQVLFSSLGMPWLFSGLEMYSYITTRSLAIKTVAIISMFLWVKNANDVYKYALILASSTLIAYALNFAYATRLIRWERIHFSSLKRHIKPMLVLFASILAISVYTSLDTIMLGFISGDEEVGLYSAAVKVKGLLLTAINAVSAAMLPRFSYYFSIGEKKDYVRVLKKLIVYLFMMALPLTLFFILEAQDCILILGGEKYLEATICMQIIMPVLIISGFSNVLGNQILIPTGKEQYFLKAVCLGAVVDLVLNIVLMPLYGCKGAAVATLIAELIQMTVQLLYSKNVVSKSLDIVSMTKILVATTIACVLICFLKIVLRLSPFIKISFLAIAYGVCFVCVLIVLDEKNIKSLMFSVLRK